MPHLTTSLIYFFIIFYAFGCFSCVYVYACMRYACEVRYLRRPEEGSGPSGTEITGVCELPCMSWESNPKPSGKATSVLSHQNIPPVLFHFSNATTTASCFSVWLASVALKEHGHFTIPPWLESSCLLPLLCHPECYVTNYFP